MTKERYNSLMREESSLTPEEVKAGWHFCPDWDYLLISSSSPEMASCTCNDIDLERG